MFPSASERWIALCAALAVFFVAAGALFTLVGSEPLGHDEAVYLIKARSWIDGSPADQWGPYRPIAMSLFGWVMLHAGDAEKTVRLFGVVFAPLAPLFTFLLFRRIGGYLLGALAALLVITSPLFLEQGPQFLNDIPSAAMLVALLWVLLVTYQSAGKSDLIYAAAPLAALAFYLRYGVTTSLIMIALFSYLILMPRFLMKEGHDFKKLGRTVLIAIALFVPHLVHSFFATGSPFGILKRAEEVAHRAYLGEGLIQYLKWLPDTLAGLPIGIAAIVGALACVVLLGKREWRSSFASILWLGWIGIGAFFLTGLLVHAEERYVVFPLVILAGAGAAVIHRALARWSPDIAIGAAIALIVLVLAYGATSLGAARAYFEGKRADRYRLAYVEASRAIQNDARGPCTVWAIGTYSPAVSWYSRCGIFIVSTPSAFKTQIAGAAPARYSIVITKSAEDQLTPQRAASFGVTLTELLRKTGIGGRGDLEVYRVN